MGIVFQIGLPSSTSQTVPSGGGWAHTAAHQVRPIGVATFSRRLDLRVGARPRGPGLGPRVLASISSVRRGQLELRLWTVREAREGREDGRQENELGDDDEGDCAVHWSPPP
jgi:hypothetical protein